MHDPATMHYAIATATALAGIGAATAWAIQARDADRARRDAEHQLARRLAEAERLRRESDAALAAMREELRQARLALVAAEAELDLVRQDHGGDLSQN